MTIAPWKLGLLLISVVWAMLVAWNFSNEPLSLGLLLGALAWSIPIAGLYGMGRTLTWLFCRRQPRYEG